MAHPYTPTIIYEDNHLLCVAKRPGEIVQGDKTGDEPMSEALKAWLKEKYQKPGNVYLGVIHRLDRPVGGLVIFAKTSKALSRMNELFRSGEVSKRYWAIVTTRPPRLSDTLEQYLVRNEQQNKSYVAPRGADTPGAKLPASPTDSLLRATAITSWRSSSIRGAIIRSVASSPPSVARSRET